jgi:hypothetical protein
VPAAATHLVSAIKEAAAHALSGRSRRRARARRANVKLHTQPSAVAGAITPLFFDGELIIRKNSRLLSHSSGFCASPTDMN